MVTNISIGLKKARSSKDLHADTVVELLCNRGFRISAKTLYSYESGNSMPNADLFLSLCEIYQITDILSEFGYSDRTGSLPIGFFFDIPLISCIYEYGVSRRVDVSPIFRFFLAPENSSYLSSIISNSGLPFPAKNHIESVIGCSLEDMLHLLGKRPEEIIALTLTKADIQQIKIGRRVIAEEEEAEYAKTLPKIKHA